MRGSALGCYSGDYHDYRDTFMVVCQEKWQHLPEVKWCARSCGSVLIAGKYGNPAKCEKF